MTHEKISELRNSGFAVDDENEPITENIPVSTTVDAVADTAIDRNAIASEDWGFDGVDQWRTSGGGVFSPSKLKTTDYSSIPSMPILEFFLLFYPCDYIKLTITPQTNKHISHRDMDLSEFLKFVACWIYIACFGGVVNMCMWWSNTEVNMFEGASGRLTKYMSLNRFEDILCKLSYTDNNVPACNVKLFHICHMEDAWNANTTKVFEPS